MSRKLPPKKPRPEVRYYPQWPCRTCGQDWKHCPCPHPGGSRDYKKKPINDMNDQAPFTPPFERPQGSGTGDASLS